MGVEICFRCDTHIDLDYDMSGHYFDNTHESFVCGSCLTDEEIDKLEEEEAS